ncbi:precorrin-3B synthase [Variovorax sp. HJSM1_2]|uniref:precorrin-3B synthase n=1 Tax=Variovorax sp. HJSM1_2 TaxID=3366263 RepID=UPI003BE2CBB8
MNTAPQNHTANTATTQPQVYGWCPGALRPMPSGDGLVVRIRPPGGRLTSAQAQGIAQLASQYAWPVLDLTSRANIQLRGVATADHPALMRELQALQLVDTSLDAEARRNLLVTPFWQAGDGTTDLAQALTAALASPHAPTLPSKFGFALDCGESPVLRACSADIRIERSASGYLVCADGSPHGAPATPDEVLPLALELTHWFVDAGGVQAGRGRMAALLTNSTLPPRFSTVPRRNLTPTAPPLGLVPQGCVVGFEFGQLPAETLAALGALGPLRITPWRSLLIEGLPQLPALDGLITQDNDARLRVAACTGAPGCSQAAGATRVFARDWAALVPHGQVLHVSGCSKGCAHPGATLTLVATATGFNLIPHGTAASAPTWRALDAAAVASHLQHLSHAPRI